MSRFARLHRRVPRHAYRAWAAVLAAALLWSGTAAGQLPIETPAPAPAQEPAAWQPPAVTNLPLEWWQPFQSASPEVRLERFQRLLRTIGERIQGLDPDSLVAAANALDNLRSLVDLYAVSAQSDNAADIEAVLTKELYSLDDMFTLRRQLRDVNRRQAELKLRVGQLERQESLLETRRETLLRQYQASAVESPRRVLLGIDRIAARVEYELSRIQAGQLVQQLQTLEQQADLIDQQQEFALEHLTTGALTIAELESRLAEARARIAETAQNVSAAQKQLLDALSDTPVKPSLELLRKQQLTRASAEASLAQLEEALEVRKSQWYRLRRGVLEPGFDPEANATRAAELIEDTLRQVDVWSATSQATLVSSPPRDTLNSRKNFEIAQSVARDTLLLTGDIRDRTDDLRLIQQIVTQEVIASQSGLGKAWASLKLTSGRMWQAVSGVIDYKLFSIGEAPVTPGGLFKVLMILLIAYAISRIIRHGLDHATGRQQFAKSPAIYTLGRLLHYVIILIGVFAALGSIGMDFTNFALIAGALSVGIGFGLQAIVNNFVSGLILLFEGSLRIGDYIELDSGLAGVVKEINTRATVVNSNDGVDVVVPNSELVTTKLTNWTLRESFGRLRIPFGVAYGSDKDKVKEVALEAASEMEFILLNMKGREPQVRLVNFGDSSLDFELLAWVSRQGIRRPHRVRASFLWALETKLTEAGIEIPFPQRDLHFKNAPPAGEPAPQPAQPGSAQPGSE